MASRARDWIGAASCCEGPRPAATFADLPRAHQHEMVRFAMAAVLSTAFFLAVGILTRALPSRSLAARVGVLDPSTAHPVLMDMRQASTFEPRPMRQTRERPARRLTEPPADQPLADQPEADEPAAYQPVAYQAPPTTEPAVPERKKNIFSRIFHGVFRTGAAASPKPDIPE